MRLTEENIKDSSLKIEEEFNNCPGGKVLKELLDEEVGVYNFVDIEGINYWKNERDTLVISLLGIDKRALAIGKIAMSANEYDYTIIPVIGGNMVVVRLWWD
jgi:hypothetical protein